MLSLLADGWQGPGTLLLVADRALLAAVARHHGLEPAWLTEPTPEIRLIDCAVCGPELVRGRPDARAGAASLAYLERALALIDDGQASALVTCPISKEALALAGRPYPGHTEFLAEATGAAPVMMFDAPDLRVSLVTTHIPLAAVPAELEPARVERVVRVTERTLRERYGLERPRLGLLGLNPHAGEAGLLGAEEQRWLGPLAERLRAEGLALEGPLPPDTAFTPRWRGRLDAHVALYHDQGLIPLKALAFEQACQVTLGLPFPRTSVAHGTAHDLVGTLEASTGSLRRALAVAAQLTRVTRAARHGS